MLRTTDVKWTLGMVGELGAKATRITLALGITASNTILAANCQKSASISIDSQQELHLQSGPSPQ